MGVCSPEVRSMNSHQEMWSMWELRVGDMSAKKAVKLGLAYKCPTCRIVHPGLRYMHPDHRQYCSTGCFRNRDNPDPHKPAE